MREDIKLWIEALRSGEYKQTKGALEYNGGYCCLGVYAKLNNIPYNVGYRDPDTGLVTEENSVEDSDAYRAIYSMIDNYGLCEEGIEMNDSGKSFAEIADMIEKAYKDD